ncbi:hypothetical protein KGM_215830 [Danaus plexippus plexippus]|uniref:Uncharacterized protein n=1 Tax=Danaus plexippus plexippus TaxID=278856 RepID=A0A212ESX8_DANPL|nr:hypothetical protein KGM_215830 [Danaus plexippus plexippus]
MAPSTSMPHLCKSWPMKMQVVTASLGRQPRLAVAMATQRLDVPPARTGWRVPDQFSAEETSDQARPMIDAYDLEAGRQVSASFRA